MKRTKLIFHFFALIFFSIHSFGQNKSFDFNGSSQYISVADDPLIDFSSNLTIEAWILLKDQNGYFSIVDKGWCGASDFSYFFAVEDGKLVHSWNSDGNCNYSSSAKTDNIVINSGVCYHVAVTHSATSVKFYVNGIETTSTVTTGSVSDFHNSSEPLLIGIYKNIAGNLVLPMNGQIDELRLWNSERSSTEILNNHNKVLAGDETGLIAYYRFDDAATGPNITVPNSSYYGMQLDGTTSTSVYPSLISACETLINLGLEENYAGSNFQLINSVYPNPGASELHIDLPNHTNIQYISILDQTGKVLQEINPSTNQVNVDMKNTSNGIYFIQVIGTSGEHQTIKWVKSKD